MKSFGMSQLRMMLALAPVAILIALPQFWIDSTFVPSSVAKLRAWGVGDYKPAAARDETGLAWARQGHDVFRFGAATQGGPRSGERRGGKGWVSKWRTGGER